MVKRVILIFLAAALLILFIGPFLVPVPPLTDTRPAQELGDADSQFIQLNGMSVHVKEMGSGKPALVLLHGFGASLYSWQAVMEPLSRVGTVLAYDRTGFGLSERPLEWAGQNPYTSAAQRALLIALLDRYGIDKAVLVGNSAGGTLALQTALDHPERVQALILVDPAVYGGGGAPAWIRPLLSLPQARHLGPLLVRQIQNRGLELMDMAWHDASKIPAETLALYQKPLQADNWDRGLWEFTRVNPGESPASRLNEIKLLVLVITGDDDRIVPTADSIRLAGEIPGAQLVVIPEAGHVPHEEKPEAFLEAVMPFLASAGIID